MSNPNYELPATDVGIEGYVWLQDIGEVDFANNSYAGTRDQGRRMEGFQVSLVNPPGNPPVAIQYRVYASNYGWMPSPDGWVDAGQYAGTKNQGLGLQAFVMQLVNPDVSASTGYVVRYLAHQENNGDIPLDSGGETLPGAADGTTVGDPGSGLRLEGLALTVIKVGIGFS